MVLSSHGFSEAVKRTDVMKTFSNKDVENYYDETEVHYRQFWKLDKNMGLHYGVWDETTKNLSQAVLNANEQLQLLGDIQKEHYVLDAGCGVGGSSIYLAKNVGCKATGITLSKKQTETAAKYAEREGVSHLVDFQQQDYTKTDFADNTFDIAWAIESMTTAPSKVAFFKEMCRVLKPGGRLVVADFFKTRPFSLDDDKDMQVMFNGWAIEDIQTVDQFREDGENNGFKLVGKVDHTQAVKKSVNTLYYAYMAGAWYSKLYNFFNKNTGAFARDHYKTALAQYKSYKKGLWCYYNVAFEKL